MYKDLDFNTLFNNSSKYGMKFKKEILNDDKIKRAEDIVGYKFSSSYIEFLKIQNGGYIKNKDCWLNVIYGIGNDDDDDTNSIENTYSLWINEWEYPKYCLPFGSTQSGGPDMYCFDYRNCIDNEPSIIRIDVDLNCEYFVAHNFKEFIYKVYNNEDIMGDK